MDPHALVAALLAALLACVPRVPQPQRGRIERTREAIVAAGVEAEVEDSVPAGLFLAVGFLETRLGTDDGEGGGYGAPVSRTRRGVAGTPAHASRALAVSFVRCGARSWLMATTRFRTGYCTFARRLVGYEPTTAIRLARRMYERAGIALPPGL